MSVICQECSNPAEDKIVEFPTLKELSDHVKAGHPSTEEPEEEAPAPELVPITLHYKFEGQCPTCGRMVDTITVEFEEKDTMVAYCSSCKTQHDTKEVIPLRLQLEKKKQRR